MSFDWRWAVGTIAAIWILGWFVSTAFMFFFDPLTTREQKRKEWRRRLVASCGLNCFLWPFILPPFWWAYRFHRDMRTGKRPDWLVIAHDEQSGRQWTLSDGTNFGGSGSGGSSTELSHISADFDDDTISAPVDYRVRMLAPTAQPATDWARMRLTERGPEPDPDDEDAVDDYVSSRYWASVQLPRGKYAVEFRVTNRSGRVEECSGVTLIVSDHEDFD